MQTVIAGNHTVHLFHIFLVAASHCVAFHHPFVVFQCLQIAACVKIQIAFGHVQPILGIGIALTQFFHDSYCLVEVREGVFINIVICQQTVRQRGVCCMCMCCMKANCYNQPHKYKYTVRIVHIFFISSISVLRTISIHKTNIKLRGWQPFPKPFYFFILTRRLLKRTFLKKRIFKQRKKRIIVSPTLRRA